MRQHARGSLGRPQRLLSQPRHLHHFPAAPGLWGARGLHQHPASTSSRGGVEHEQVVQEVGAVDELARQSPACAAEWVDLGRPCFLPPPTPALVRTHQLPREQQSAGSCAAELLLSVGLYGRHCCHPRCLPFKPTPRSSSAALDAEPCCLPGSFRAGTSVEGGKEKVATQPAAPT